MLLVALLVGSTLGVPRDGVAAAASAEPRSRHWAVILVGIPGDEEHASLFNETATLWQQWLVKSLGIPDEQVLRLPASGVGDGGKPPVLTAEAAGKAFVELSGKLTEDDALWVFTLGHGHHDGKQSWFHVSGRDPSGDDFALWLSKLRCREQVVWLTHAASGWFVKPLSKPGRVVIAATEADNETNETEFPHALAAVAGRGVDDLDSDHDGQVSVAELYTAVVAEVRKRFRADRRVATEHAQLDDDGDGKGTEIVIEEARPDDADEKPAAAGKVDGALAKKTLVPYRAGASKEK